MRKDDKIDSFFDDIVIGCVAENSPKYLAQAIRLVQSIRWFGGKLAGAECIVCVVEGIDAASRKELEKYSAKIRIVERFSEEHPQSNKLRFVEQKDVIEHKNILLLDCDTIVVQDPSPYFGDGFRAKIADASTVPYAVFERLFRHFQLPVPAQEWECTATGEATIPYFNAGVLFFNGDAISALIPKWVEINGRLIKKIDLLGDCSNYCEQASLSLALAATRTSFTALGNEVNFPCHFENRRARLENIDPIILHYHWLVDAAGYINFSPYPFVNRRIQQFNQRLRAEREKEFNNRLFWNFRYRDNPELGSGLGSRGEHRDYKRALLTDVVSAFRPNSILDIGCGDMEVSLALPPRGYTGIDISDVVIEKNRRSFPDRTFLCGNILDRTVAASDMVICMDVLIHLSDYDYYRQFVERIIALTAGVGVIAGYEKNPEYKGIIFFHEPLSETLRSCGVTEMKKIGEYRDTAIVQFLAPSWRQYVTYNHYLDGEKNKINFSDQDKRKQKAICILGMHRSGTSAVTRALNLLGVYLGEERDLLPAEDFNPAGLWERTDFTLLQEKLLGAIKRPWHTAAPLPSGWKDMPEVKRFKAEIGSLIKEKFSGVPVWAWKDPRSTIFLELWKETLGELGMGLSAVFVLRNPLDVARSLQKRDGFSLDKGFGIWFNYNIAALRSIKDIPTVFVSYDRFITDWGAELRRVAEALDIQWPQNSADLQEKMSSFVRLDLRHSTSTREDLKISGVPRSVMELHELFERLLAGEPLDSPLNQAQVERLWDAFSSNARFYQQDMTALWEKERQLHENELQTANVHRQLHENELQIANVHRQLRQLVEMDRRIDELGRMLAEKDRQLAEKEGTLAAHDRRIYDLTTSLSWKMTAPLRLLAQPFFDKMIRHRH